MARDESGQALNRAHRAKHLLSGLIFCGECGAPFAMRDARRYGCRNFRSRGTCGNDALVDRYDLERVVAAGLQERWLTVANLEALRAQVEARYAEQTAGAGEARAKLIAKAARVEGKMARVVSAIADARHSAPLLAKLADLEAESKRLALEIEEADTSAPPLVLSTAELEEAVRNFTTHIEGVFDSPAANAALLRETVRGMIDKIVVTPRPNGSPLFTIEGESIGLLRATGLLGDAGPQTQKNPGGGGFRGFGVGGCGGRI
ncbi:MAG: zinc ribbon domain-containing protein [Hyphomicrobiales bacterium]|nr:zinc ribbon domain-containing protein [Hyphomicrobiales bacterium]